MNSQSSSSQLHISRMLGLDRDEEDCMRLGIEHRFVHISALSPATRTSHAERSGRLFTADEIRKWATEGSNSEDCRCSFFLILVDDSGQPFSSSLVGRLEAARDRFLEERRASDHSS